MRLCGKRSDDILEALNCSSSGSNNNTPSFTPFPMYLIVSFLRMIDDDSYYKTRAARDFKKSLVIELMLSTFKM